MQKSSEAGMLQNSGRRRHSGAWAVRLTVVAAAFWVLVPLAPMPIVSCPCDHARPDSMTSRVCSLCGTAGKQTDEIYFLKDINPHKPNRYLALPKAHGRGFQSTADLTASLRAKLWRRAAERAEELFPGRWGLAQNSHFFRTQCHAHIHIGPLSPEVEDTEGTVYASVEEFPNVGPEQGTWVHPKDGKFCLHLDRDLAEIVLVR